MCSFELPTPKHMFRQPGNFGCRQLPDDGGNAAGSTDQPMQSCRWSLVVSLASVSLARKLGEANHALAEHTALVMQVATKRIGTTAQLIMTTLDTRSDSATATS